MTDIAIEPVVREIEVAAPIDTCFDVFVDGIDSWWPREHHIGAERDVERFVVEPVVGGRCYDVDTEGGISHWGTVLDIERPTRFVFAWHVQDWTRCDTDPAKQSEVHVAFSELGAERTLARIEHRHLERHDAADMIAQGVGSPGGWSGDLQRFADVAEGQPPRPLPAD